MLIDTPALQLNSISSPRKAEKRHHIKRFYVDAAPLT